MFLLADDGNHNGDDDENETHPYIVTVFDENEEPLSDANVNIITYDSSANMATSTTGEDSVAEFELEDGSYRTIVSHEDYVGCERELFDIQDENYDLAK